MGFCDWCNISEKEKQWLLFSTEYWDIYLANEQDYVGRSILVLKRHCGSLSELNMSEWDNLKNIIERMEFCYKEIPGAELCNWSCLMKNFYKQDIPNPHLHIHVRPRYKNGVVLNETRYDDLEYGHHYALKNAVKWNEKDWMELYRKMKTVLDE